jgi:hypothetical protein
MGQPKMLSCSAVGMILGPVRSRLPRGPRRILGVWVDRRLGRPGGIGASQPRALPHLDKRIGFVGLVPIGHAHVWIVRSLVDGRQATADNVKKVELG